MNENCKLNFCDWNDWKWLLPYITVIGGPRVLEFFVQSFLTWSTIENNIGRFDNLSDYKLPVLKSRICICSLLSSKLCAYAAHMKCVWRDKKTPQRDYEWWLWNRLKKGSLGKLWIVDSQTTVNCGWNKFYSYFKTS